MIQIDNKLLVKFPGSAKYPGELDSMIRFYYKIGRKEIELNSELYEVVGETKSITEEQAEKLGIWIKVFGPVETALESFHSWMEANKVPLEDNYLILIKK